MVVGGFLFASRPLGEVLGARLQGAVKRVESIDHDVLLSTPTPDIVEPIVGAAAIMPLILHEDQMEQLGVEETRVDVRNDPSRVVFDRSRPVLVAGSRVQVAIPFEGTAELFRAKPSRHIAFRAPEAQVIDGELVLTYIGIDPAPEHVRAYLDDQLQMIRTSVDFVNSDVTAFSRQLS